jgi:hypothetical protein
MQTPTPSNETIESLTEKVMKDIPNEILIQLSKVEDQQDLIKYHFNLGMSIRNNYNLWQLQVMKKVKVDGQTHEIRIHPDDVSHEIIVNIWKKTIKEIKHVNIRPSK